MRWRAQLAVGMAALAAAGGALASTPVSAGSATTGVATLELIDPGTWTGRSVSTHDGVYFRLCDRGSLRPCSLGRGAKAVRAQAFELARATLQTSAASLVVVALPQSATRSALLVFERDILVPGLDPLRATAERLYLMGGLVPYSDTEDSLLLVRLRPSPAERPGR